MFFSITALQRPPKLFRLWCNLVPTEYPPICRTSLVGKAAELCIEAKDAEQDDSDSAAQLVNKLQAMDAELAAFQQQNFNPDAHANQKALRACPNWNDPILRRDGAPTKACHFGAPLNDTGALCFSQARIQVHLALLKLLPTSGFEDTSSSEDLSDTEDMSSFEDKIAQRRESITAICAALEHINEVAVQYIWLPDGTCSLPASHQLRGTLITALGAADVVTAQDPSKRVIFEWTRQFYVYLSQVQKRHGYASEWRTT